MKPGKAAWTIVEGHPAKVMIVEFGKGPYANVRFTNGKEREVLKELLTPKKVRQFDGVDARQAE